ncbi:Transposase IS116/IS110/IS902 family [Bordetella ansorpii]|uniref:Transposase IS116/IS110/IS902 family n=1 Tax=Bordetella ansorpii TaxID=288768 RepID=A0A157SUX7_9BORD|nr:IS110 family transposase [Bordetella ansorpii]SAI74247.1 Transposase IS116/IS110/IS902 family [Bordetella ansorpii]
MKITAIGLDLAKQVFQVHGVDESGKPVIRKRLKRDQLTAFFAQLPPCLVGMEACASAHHWARVLRDLGHEVRLISPQFVKPYVKSNKNDANDAEAICEAVGRPSMRFVAIKSIDQQTVLSMHRAREGFVKARTATGNQIRGLLAEFGLILPAGLSNLGPRVPALLEQAADRVGPALIQLIDQLMDHLKLLDARVKELEKMIANWHRHDPVSQRLAQIPGIGPITASALVASVADPRLFKNGRHMAAWIGLVPRQHSSGGKSTLLGLSKRGDGYLRRLLLLGAQSVLMRVRQPGAAPSWAGQLLQRRHVNVVAAALANKNARIAWALMARPQDYVPCDNLT